MKYIKKIVAYSIIGLTLMGCASKTYYTGGKRMQSKDYAKPGIVMKANVEEIKSKPSTLDELISRLKIQEEQLEARICLERYDSEISKINQDITNKNYSSVQNRVRNLINLTEKDTDKCSREINESLKRYTYRKYDYTKPRYEVRENISDNPMKHLLDIGNTIIDILELRPNLNRLGTMKKERKIIEEGHYKIIEVNPYRGTEKQVGKISTK